jgi:predicted GIY-YIG superfamily endonuclease
MACSVEPCDKPKAGKMAPMRAHHHVYVVELHPEVCSQAQFARANPGYIAGQMCLYVGMTGLDPDTRFDQHMAGIKANRFVTRYGLRLLPELVAHLRQPMTYGDAQYMEVDMAIRFREQGYGVWQA